MLIGDDRQRETRRLQGRQAFADARQELDLRGIVKEGDIADQGAVAVEQHEASRGFCRDTLRRAWFEMAAMRSSIAEVLVAKSEGISSTLPPYSSTAAAGAQR